MFENADVTPTRKTYLENNLRRIPIGLDLDNRGDTSGIIAHRRSIHLLAEEFLAELFDQLFGFHTSCRQMELPSPHLPKPLHQFRSILRGQPLGGIA